MSLVSGEGLCRSERCGYFPAFAYGRGGEQVAASSPTPRVPPCQSTIGDKFQTMSAIEIEHCSCGFFDRPPRHVDRLPTMFRKKPARGSDLLGNRGAIDILCLPISVKREQPILADLHDSVRGRDKPHN